MKTSLARRVAGFCLCLLMMTWGCYTVLKHPRVPVADTGAQEDAVDWERVSFSNECGACHETATGSFHAIAIPPPRPAPSPQWLYYYDTPWWFQYYSVPAGAGGSMDSSDEQQKRGFDRRQLGQGVESTANNLPPAAPIPPAGSVAKPSTTESEAEPAPKASTGNEDQKREGKRAIDSQESNRRTRKN